MWIWVFLRHSDLVPTNLHVFSAEVMDQAYCQSLESCFSFLICGAYSIMECSSYVSCLHQKKSLHWAFPTSFQHKCTIEKAELLTEVSSSLELVLLEWSCSMQWLEWLNKWSLEPRMYSSAVHVLSSLWTVRYTVTLGLRLASWVFTSTVVYASFPSKKRGRICQFNLFAANHGILENLKLTSQTPQNFQLPYTLAGDWGNSRSSRDQSCSTISSFGSTEIQLRKV